MHLQFCILTISSQASLTAVIASTSTRGTSVEQNGTEDTPGMTCWSVNVHVRVHSDTSACVYMCLLSCLEHQPWKLEIMSVQVLLSSALNKFYECSTLFCHAAFMHLRCEITDNDLSFSLVIKKSDQRMLTLQNAIELQMSKCDTDLQLNSRKTCHDQLANTKPFSERLVSVSILTTEEVLH